MPESSVHWQLLEHPVLCWQCLWPAALCVSTEVAASVPCVDTSVKHVFLAWWIFKPFVCLQALPQRRCSLIIFPLA